MKPPGKKFRMLPDTVFHLRSKYPRKERNQLSYRKQVCLFYLEWCLHPQDKEMRQQFVELVKEWRKKEPNRLGGKRSLLERMVRKRLFKLAKREKLNKKNYEALCSSVNRQKKNKTGQFTDEMVAFRKSSENGKRAKRTNGCHWYVYAPDGTMYEIFSLRAFCREHGLDQSHMTQTNLQPNKTHKGWRAVKKNPFIDLSDFTD